MADDQAIWIHCEGSGCPPNLKSCGIGLCAMCGRPYTVLAGDVMPEHHRKDIITMLNRGDFDG